MNKGKRLVAGVLSALLMLQGFSAADYKPIGMQKAYANILMPVSKFMATKSVDTGNLALESNDSLDSSIDHANATEEKYKDSAVNARPTESQKLEAIKSNSVFLENYIAANNMTTSSSIQIPSNIVIETTDTTLTVSWGAIEMAQNYDVSIDESIINTKDLMYTFTSLKPDTQYKIKVRTYNPSGAYGLIGDINGDGRINVLDFAKLGIYLKLHEGESSEQEFWTSDLNGDGAINALDYSLMKMYLLNSSKHFPKGESAWSPEVQKYTMLSAPENLSATPSSTTMVLTWDAVDGATGYDVEVYGTAQDNGNSTSYIQAGLEPNSKLTYRVRAKNANGVSSWSNRIAATTLPAPTFNLQTQASDNSVKVLWNAQAGVSGYELEIDGQQVIELAENSYIHKDLASNSHHTYRVRSKNEYGVSTWSKATAAVVLPTVPGNFIITSVSGSAIELSWDTVSGAKGYDIEVDGKIINNGLKTTYSHNELKPNEEHTYRVRARNAEVEGKWTSEIRKKTLPPAPENFKAISAGNQIKLEWDIVADAQYYEVEIDGDVLKAGAVSVFIYSGLSAGKDYTYRVRAVNDSGSGAWSSATATTVMDDVKPDDSLIDEAQSEITQEILDLIKKSDSDNYAKNLNNYRQLLKDLNVHTSFKNEIENLIKKGKKLPDILTAYSFLNDGYGSITELEKLITKKESGKTWASIFTEYNKNNPQFEPRDFNNGYLEKLLKAPGVGHDDIMIADRISQKTNAAFDDIINKKISGLSWRLIKAQYKIVNGLERSPYLPLTSGELKDYTRLTGLDQETVVGWLTLSVKLGIPKDEIISFVIVGLSKEEVYAKVYEERYY